MQADLIDFDSPDAYRQASRRAAELDRELQQIRRQMQALVQSFRHQWPDRPRPVYPGIHIGGRERAPVIRWRLGGAPGHRQSWLTLTSDVVAHHLEHQVVPQAMRRAWVDVDRRAQRLNARASIVAAERRVLRAYLEHLTDLDKLEKRWSGD